MLVVAKAEMTYFQPAYFDDELTIETRVVSTKGAAIVHEYLIKRGEDEIVQGTTRVGCLTKEGKVTRVPAWLVVKVTFRDLPRGPCLQTHRAGSPADRSLACQVAA